MEKQYICPKAKECLQLYPNNECRHVHKHQYSINCKDADIINKCPFPDTVCVEYKPGPVPEPQLYILPPKETQYYKHSIVKDPDSREAQLYDKAIQDTTVDAVYSVAKPVDIEKLAELINKSADEWDKERINLNSKYVGKRFADYIKQAIQDYLKEVN